jgi:uncharacterized protein with HEPN domain
MKDPQIYLSHILESIEEIENHLAGFSLEMFIKDRKTQDAVVRQFMIIGEATKHLPPSMMAEYSDVRWQDVMGMRDRLIHEYFNVMMELVWDTAKHDLPKFKRQILKMIK